MEALWVLLGSALSTSSGIIFWLLNSRTAREVQGRQQKYDLQMQEQRLDAQRVMAADEAIRAARKARLQPVFEVVAELELSLAYFIWTEVLKGVDTEVKPEALAAFYAGRAPPEGALELAQKAAREVVAGLRKEITEPSSALVARAAPVIHRLPAGALRDDLLELLLSVSRGEVGKDTWSKMGDMHARLEAYVARIQ